MTPSEWIRTQGEVVQYALFFVLFASLLLGERYWPARRPGGGGRRSRGANVALTLTNVLVLGLLPFSFVSASEWAATRGGGGLLPALDLSPAPLLLANLLVRSFISFSTHLLMHHVPLFWRVHRVHHLDTALDVSTTVRFHPLEFVIGLVIGVPIVVAFGLAPWMLVLYELLDVVVTLVSHANVRLPERVERALRVFVVTPGLHRVHHSTRPEEANSNFGAVFPLWDLLLGTFRAGPLIDGELGLIGLAEVRGEKAGAFGWLLTVPVLGSLANDFRRSPRADGLPNV